MELAVAHADPCGVDRLEMDDHFHFAFGARGGGDRMDCGSIGDRGENPCESECDGSARGISHRAGDQGRDRFVEAGLVELFETDARGRVGLAHGPAVDSLRLCADCSDPCLGA